MLCVCIPPYRLLHRQQKLVYDQIKDIDQGVIQHSLSPWNSPLFLVPENDEAFRSVIDFRRLNNLFYFIYLFIYLFYFIYLFIYFFTYIGRRHPHSGWPRARAPLAPPVNPALEDPRVSRAVSRISCTACSYIVFTLFS